MKLIFFGTPDFVLPIPQALLAASFKIAAVVTSPDKPVGRKQILTPSPVKLWAQKNGIQVFTPEILNSEFIINNLAPLKPEVIILAAYGKILPSQMLELPKHGALCIHPSLLPKYRGASPIQSAIMAGEKETGVSIIKMDSEMDHGPIVAQFKEEIKSDDTPFDLYDRLFKQAADQLVTILPDYAKGKIQARAPNHPQATYTKILKKDDGFIPYGIIAPKRGSTSKCKLGPYNLEPTAENLERFIRAMSPWPGAWTLLRPFGASEGQAKRLKILKAHLEAINNLVLDSVQLEGKNPVTWKQFVQGHPQSSLASPEAS